MQSLTGQRLTSVPCYRCGGTRPLCSCVRIHGDTDPIIHTPTQAVESRAADMRKLSQYEPTAENIAEYLLEASTEIFNLDGQDNPVRHRLLLLRSRIIADGLRA